MWRRSNQIIYSPTSEKEDPYIVILGFSQRLAISLIGWDSMEVTVRKYNLADLHYTCNRGISYPLADTNRIFRRCDN